MKKDHLRTKIKPVYTYKTNWLEVIRYTLLMIAVIALSTGVYIATP